MCEVQEESLGGAGNVATTELMQGGSKASRGHHVAQASGKDGCWPGLAWLPLRVCFPNVASALHSR